jgi:hypothetical protein
MKKSYLLLGLLLLTLNSCNDHDEIVISDLYPENLVGYYPFNGNSLNEIDFENNGLVEGAILTSDIGNSENSAFSFDGIDDTIKINHDAVFNLSNEFTISALIKPEEIKTQHIVRKGVSVNGTGRLPYGISLSATGDIVFSVTTENGQILNQARKQGYEINEWYLITGVFKESEMLLYVNGELEVSEITNAQITTNTEPLIIGSRLGLPSDTFKGTIDEVRIYNSGLTEFEVTEIYNNL